MGQLRNNSSTVVGWGLWEGADKIHFKLNVTLFRQCHYPENAKSNVLRVSMDIDFFKIMI